MSLGTSLITRKSSIRPELASRLAEHQYFQTKRFEDQTRIFTPGQTNHMYDLLVEQFLIDEGFDTSDHSVEYWFQGHSNGSMLYAHCDYNHYARNTPGFDPRMWMEAGRDREFISPVTIAAYIEITDDLEGGRLGISSTPCHTLANQFPTIESLADTAIEYFSPQAYDVVYFKGSIYPHWIEPVTRGSRKSMLINFWSRNDK